MTIPRSILLPILLALLVVQLLYISTATPHYLHFRDYIDAVVLVTFILAAYFIWQWLQVAKKMPVRVLPLNQGEGKEGDSQTKRKVKELIESKEFREYQKRKETGQQHEGELTEDEREFVREVQEKETEIFE